MNSDCHMNGYLLAAKDWWFKGICICALQVCRWGTKGSGSAGWYTSLSSWFLFAILISLFWKNDIFKISFARKSCWWSRNNCPVCKIWAKCREDVSSSLVFLFLYGCFLFFTLSPFAQLEIYGVTSFISVISW